MIIKFSHISQNGTDKAEHGRKGEYSNDHATDLSLVTEERRLNFTLKELLSQSEQIMERHDNDKWTGIEMLIKRMQEELSYLITADLYIELDYEEELYGQRMEFHGPYNYKQFLEALRTPEELKKIHEYIVHNYGLVKHKGQKRETLFAEDQLLMLYSALKYEKNRHDASTGLYKSVDEQIKIADKELHPHFGMNGSDSMQEHWVDVYHRLIKNGWLYSNEVSSAEWVYICCGKRTQPKGFVVWHGTTAALAYIVRTKLGSKWHLAHQIFCRPEGEKLPVSFNTTKNPAQKVIEEIDKAFSICTNSH